MGLLHYVTKPFFEKLGFEYVDLPEPSLGTITLGLKYAPEFACFPLKAVLGEAIIAARMDVDYFVILGGTGPCRFGWYGVTIQEILGKLGYKMEVLIFDLPKEPWAREAYEKIGLKKNGIPVSKIAEGAIIAFQKMRLVEYVDELARKWRPVEVEKRSTNIARDNALELIEKQNKPVKLLMMRRKIKGLFMRVKRDLKKIPPRVGIVGEIYMVLEPAYTLRIEERLGELGALVDRRASGMYNYIIGDIGINFWHRMAIRAARPYLKYHAGGESIYSVGYSALFAKANYDGVVHISPLGCMPEIVAQTVMNRISRDYDIPILNLIFDEQTAEAGIQTRIEAFVDLIKRRKNVSGN